MLNKDMVCLYDGFKIRNYDPSYFNYVVKHAEKFNLILSYRMDTKDLSLPISSTLGCTLFEVSNLDLSEQKYIIPEANPRNGFKISLKMVCKDNQMKRCVEISGSFHKFSNDWYHNADDFLIGVYEISVLEFIEYFKIPPETSEVCNLEIGLNLELPDSFKAKELCSSILFFKGKTKTESETRKDRNKKGYSYYTENSIGKKKVYSKSDQYKKSSEIEIIRVELKLIKRREIIRALGIKNLKDLLDISFHQKAAQYYLKNIQGLFFYQKEIEELIPKTKACLILNYSNPEYWESLWKKNKEAFHLHKRKYFELVKAYANQNISEIIVNMLNKKANPEK